MLRGERVVVVNGSTGGTDDYGDPTPGSEERAEVDSIVPLTFTYSTEADARGRAGVVTGAKLLLPLGSPVTKDSRIEARGVTYEVDGEVAEWRPASGLLRGGIEVALRRAEG